MSGAEVGPNSSSKEREQNTMAEGNVNVTCLLIFCVFICVLGNSFLFGYNTGVVNSPGILIKTFYAQVRLSREGKETYLNTEDGGLYLTQPGDESNKTVLDFSREAIESDHYVVLMYSITVSVFVLFGMIGALSSGKVADYYGRKKGMLLITCLAILASIFGGIPVFAKSPECLIISRALIGLHCGIGSSVAPLYLTEISPREIRGVIVACHQLFVTIGILWSGIMGFPALLGNWELWPGLFAFNAIPAILCIIMLPVCPESPRFQLIKVNNNDAAKKDLKSLRGHEDVDNELEEMRWEARRASSRASFTLRQLLMSSELRRAVLVACIIQISQPLSGINVAMTYSGIIFQQIGLAETMIPYVVAGQFAINVLATIVAAPLIERLGRRPLLIWPMCVMVLSFIVLTVCQNLMDMKQFEAQKTTLAIVVIVMLMTYIIGFALGLGPIPFIVVGEIFRQEPRAAAMSFSIGLNWFCNFIVLQTFEYILISIGAYTYLIFTVILISSLTFIFFSVPETKNKSFDDIALAIAKGNVYKNEPSSPRCTYEEEVLPVGIDIAKEA